LKNDVLIYIEAYGKLNLHDVIDYDKFNEYAITAHSTQIEGSTLTVEEASLLIDEGITPKGKPLIHSLMVTDHHQALKKAIQLGKEKIRLSQSIICSLNAAVMKSTGQEYNTALGTINAAKGELRKGAVFVQKRYFPNYAKVPSLLEALCNQVNEKIAQSLTIREQIDLSYSAHFNLVSIHPHYDGNGRTSRLVMNMIQSYYGLPMSVTFKEDKLEYFKALEDSRETENLTPFKDFMDQQYIKYLSAEIERFQKQSDKQFKGSSFLF